VPTEQGASKKQLVALQSQALQQSNGATSDQKDYRGPLYLVKYVSGVSEDDDHALKLLLLNKNNRNNFMEDLSYHNAAFKIIKHGENGAYIKYTSFQRMQTEDGFDEIQESERCIWVSSFEQGSTMVKLIHKMHGQ